MKVYLLLLYTAVIRLSFCPGKERAEKMKTLTQHYGLWGLWVLLLIGIGVAWLKHDVGILKAVAAWVHHLSSHGSFMFAGLYGLVPAFYLRGAVPPMTGAALCGGILGRIVMLMGTTIGVMMVCLMARHLARVWYVFRVASLVSTMNLFMR